MTIYMLLEILKKEFEDLFSGFLLFSPQKEMAPIKIFLQNLPAPKPDNSHFPFIIIRDMGITDMGNEPFAKADITIVIGIYDNDSMYQGYKNITNVQEKIRQFLLRKRIIDNRFMLEFPLKCFPSDDFSDSTHPYFYGGMETSWRIPCLSNEESEEFV